VVEHDPGEPDHHHAKNDLGGVVELLTGKNHVSQTGTAGQHFAGDHRAPGEPDGQARANGD